MTNPFVPSVVPASAVRLRNRLPLLLSFGLAALVLVVYGGSGAHGFVEFDDGEYVSANPNVAAGLTAAGIRHAFTAFDAANWHPVTWLSHMADVQLFGMNPGAMHRVNVLLHVGNTVLLFLVLGRITGAVWRSAFVAALFGVHPLHVESVAWISERKDVLSALFLFLTIAAYAAWTRRRRRWLYAAALAACGLGLMAKPMLVTTPVLLLLLDFWPLGRLAGTRPEEGAGRRSLRALAVEKIPFVVLAAAAGAATWLAQSRAGAAANVSRFPIGERLASAAVSYVRYLRDTVWPARLAVFYPHPASIGERVPAASWLFAGALLALLTWGALRQVRRRPWIAFGWAWYVVALLPVIGLVQVGSQARADRYTYIPLIGIFAAITWGAEELTSRFRVPRVAFAMAAAACLVPLAAAARVQNGYWKDEVSLDTHAIAVTRANWVAWNNLGKHYLETDLPRAVECFRKSVGCKDDYDVAWYNLGVALGGLGRDADAIASYRRSLDLEPGNADGWANLSFEYQAVGNLAGAVAAGEEGLRRKPDHPRALASLALARARLGDRAGALALLERLKTLEPVSAQKVAAALGAR